MGKKEGNALLDFYLFSDLEDETAVDAYLLEEGLDFNSFYENFGALIKKKKAELKPAKGNKFREKCLILLKKILKGKVSCAKQKEVRGLVFHDLKNPDEDEIRNIMDDKFKMEILRKLLKDKVN